MSFFKTISDSVGTGAGVAWPLFGIVSASLSLAVGGTFALILGSICTCLFISIALGVFYLIYQKNKVEELKLDNKSLIYITEFIESFCLSYSKDNDINNEKLTAFLEVCAIQNEEFLLQIYLLKFIKKSNPSFLINYATRDQNENREILKKIIKEFNAFPILDKWIISPPMITLAGGFFLTSTAVFGSVAGTSAGIMGLFISLGFIGGFGSLPVLGGAVILVGALAAAYVAVQTTRGMIEKNQKLQVYKSFKHFNHTFSAENLENNLQESDTLSPQIDTLSSKGLKFFNSIQLSKSAPDKVIQYSCDKEKSNTV